jgi:hypothetical protein
VLFVGEKAFKENISEESKKLLDCMILEGKKDIVAKRILIEREMGQTALTLLDHNITESVFETPEGFFRVVSELWKNLNLI